MDGFGLLSTMFLYNDAMGHVTHLRPPDWLLPHIAASHGTAGIIWFPAHWPSWQQKLCEYFILVLSCN